MESDFSIKEIIPKLCPPTTASTKGHDDMLVASSAVSDISESDDDSSLGSLSTQSSDEDDKKTESKPYMNIIFDKGNRVLNLVKKGKTDARNEQDPDGENRVLNLVKKGEAVRNVQAPDGEKSNQEEQGVVTSPPKTVEQLQSSDEDDKKTESKPYMDIIFDKGNQVLNLVKNGKTVENVQDPDGENQVLNLVKKWESVRDGEKRNQEEQGVVTSQPKTVEQLQPSEKHDPMFNAPTPNDDPIPNAPTPNDESAEALFYHGKEFPTKSKDIVDQFGAKSMSEFTENEIADVILLMLRKNNEKKGASTEKQNNNNVATTQPDPVDIASSPEDFEHAMMGNLILSSLAEAAEQRDASIAKSSSAQSGKVDPEIIPTVPEATDILPTVTEATSAPEGCIDASISKSSSTQSGKVDPEIIRLLTEAIMASEGCIETKPSEECIVNKSEENDNTAKTEVGQEVLIYTMPSKYVEEDVAKENQTDIDSNSNPLGNTQDYRTVQSPIIYSGALSGGPLTTRRSRLWKSDVRRSTTSRLLKAIGRSIGRNRPEKKNINSTVGGSTTRGRRGTTASQRRIRRLRRKAPPKKDAEEEEENPEENTEALLLPPSVAM
eukprot:scaffold10319_cov50-Attheya_sp.AAC.3